MNYRQTINTQLVFKLPLVSYQFLSKMCENVILPTGLPMPMVGLGTWSIEPTELKDVMKVAFDCGYRHFDTGHAYKNEHIIGEVIEGWINEGMVKRDELFITTGLPLAGVHPDRVEMFLNESLKNLKLDYVDLYLIHYPVCVKYSETTDYPVNETGELQTEPTDHIAVWKKMEEQVECGKAKAIGLSNFTEKQISRILDHSKIKPANLQVEVHLYFQNKELVSFCKEKGIQVVAYSPLGSPGLNDYIEKNGWPTQERPKIMSDPIVIAVADKNSKSPAQIMLRYLVQRGIGVIPKSSNFSRIKENINIFNFVLDDDDMKILHKLDKGNRICDLRHQGLEKHPEFPFNA